MCVCLCVRSDLLNLLGPHRVVITALPNSLRLHTEISEKTSEIHKKLHKKFHLIQQEICMCLCVSSGLL